MNMSKFSISLAYKKFYFIATIILATVILSGAYILYNKHKEVEGKLAISTLESDYKEKKVKMLADYKQSYTKKDMDQTFSKEFVSFPFISEAKLIKNSILTYPTNQQMNLSFLVSKNVSEVLSVYTKYLKDSNWVLDKQNPSNNESLSFLNVSKGKNILLVIVTKNELEPESTSTSIENKKYSSVVSLYLLRNK